MTKAKISELKKIYDNTYKSLSLHKLLKLLLALNAVL